MEFFITMIVLFSVLLFPLVIKNRYRKKVRNKLSLIKCPAYNEKIVNFCYHDKYSPYEAALLIKAWWINKANMGRAS